MTAQDESLKIEDKKEKNREYQRRWLANKKAKEAGTQAPVVSEVTLPVQAGSGE